MTAPIPPTTVGITALSVAVILICALSSNMVFIIDNAYVRVLFLGIPIRKVALADIEFADRTWKWWNEHYNNTLNPKRIVRLRRRSGWFRNFIITPPDPEGFLLELASRGITLR